MSALPTRKDEDWRYADLGAVAEKWPLPAPEQITVAAGGEYARAIVQAEGITQIELTLEKGARARVHVLNGGGAYARVELTVTCHEGADFELGGAQLAGADTTAEIITTVRHIEPNAQSRQAVRSVAGAKGRVSYLGKVYVAKGADGTDGSQSVRAMLLDRTAEANARPELEIHADDVKCAHGCAVGELDANALFYLAQRGLAPAQAKVLMLQAFVAEAFDGAEDVDALQAAAQAALEGLL